MDVDPLRRGLPPPSEIQRIADERVANKQAIGILIATRDRKGINCVYAAGSSGRPGVALDGDSLFEIASVTKTFTATMLADLVTRGEVALDDPVSRFLPPAVHLPERNGKQITLLDLATHTSGLPRVPGNLQSEDAGNPYANYHVEHLYQFLSECNLQRDIGVEYDYSNLGYGLLGQALALKIGTSWEAAVTEQILRPLGMTDTAVTLPAALRLRLAAGHNASGQPVPNWDIPGMPGMGALRSTANDLLKFLVANMELSSPLLGEALRLTHQPQRQAWSPATMIGLAWQIGHEDHRDIIRHSGSTGGYASFIGFDPVQQIGVIVLANSAVNVFDIGFHLIDQNCPLDKP